MRMSRLPPHLAFVFYLAAVHLLLFSIGPVSSRIYQTNDAVVIEVEDVRANNFLLTSNQFGNPVPIPMAYAFNPYMGLYHQQQSNFPFWPYPLYKPVSSVSDVAATSAESRQQNIPCGVGPPTPPPARLAPPVVGIVGGTEATPNSWPFIVGLRKSSGDVFCGGSLISATRILTAAHCVDRLSVFEISTMTVSLGMHIQGNTPDTFNDAQQTRKVTRVVYHNNYNSKTKYNDVAVLTIAPPITYSSAISPVCLPPFNNTVPDLFAGKDAAIMGWGTLSFDGTQSDTLQEATVKIIKNAVCNAQYGDVILKQQLCASADGKDTCQRDDGGPLVAQISKGGSTAWTQVGISSYDYGCADPNYAAVYSSVALFRNWINTYMNN